MCSLKYKAGIFLVALGWEANIVELNLVRPGFGCLRRQGNVIFLDLGWEGSVQTSLPFSRHACPVLRDFTASSGWVVTSRLSRKIAIRAIGCMFWDWRKRTNF